MAGISLKWVRYIDQAYKKRSIQHLYFMRTTHYLLTIALLIGTALIAQNSSKSVTQRQTASKVLKFSNRDIIPRISDSVQVTFNINMQNEIISSDGVFLKGNWDGWTNEIEMVKGEESDVYSVALTLAIEQRIEYKFYNGSPANGWNHYIGENFSGECTDEWTNRFFQVHSENIILETACFNSCENCLPSEKVEVTFRVDMQETPVSGEGVFLVGNFNNWGNPLIRLSADGTIYSSEVKLTPGEQIEYRFINGDITEDNISGSCTNSNGDRCMTVPGTNEVLEPVCFNRCVACEPVNPDQVQLTFHLDATHAQYESVQLIHNSEYFQYYDYDNDRVFELTMSLDTGLFYYHVLRDNAWGWDPDNPLHPGGIPSNGAYMNVSDPMISYLLPMNNDMMRENQIQANFAFSAGNQPDINSIKLSINGNEVNNPSQYYNPAKRILLMENPPFLINGENQVTVEYTTPKGAASRTSVFSYQPVKLMMEPMIYRMDHILAWGRVFSLPYPNSVFVDCNGTVYEATVNEQGYFGTDINIQNGQNLVKTAYSETGFNEPVDEMTINADIRHKWWVELETSINGTTAVITAIPHDISFENLELRWRNSENAVDTIAGISGNSPSVSFQIPQSQSVYEIELKAKSTDGQVYYARKMLTTKSNTHFIDVNERAPWMEKMVLYEVEGDYFDWGNYTFQNIGNTFQHMVNLGVNCFRITPFVAGGFISFDHFEISPSTGTMDDLKKMVKTAHQFGLKVFFDIPLSHVASYHPFIHPSFLLKDAAEPFTDFIMWQGNPGESDVVFSPGNGRQCVYTNLDNPYTQEYFTRLMEYWVEVADCDGFRIDCGQESLLRAPGFIKQLHKRLRNIKPELFILNEGDPRDYEGVNFYEFGDAAYSWKLNSEWGNGGEGLPGIYKGVYTVNQLHNLIMAGIPSDNGLIMNYANSGYHDYLHNRYGWEQERAALSLVTTTYGLVNIRAGEEVGAVRSNGMFDFNDPLGYLPLYKRLIKARKELLGNYPAIERITDNIPDNVYVYTSKANGEVMLTAVNFSGSASAISLDLNNGAFEGLGKSQWYNISEEVTTDNTQKETMQISLDGWNASVYALNHINIPTETKPVTFRVNMQNEEVSASGVYINGSFCDWNPDYAIKLTEHITPEHSHYASTIDLPVGEAVAYKFVNGAPDNWSMYENLSGLECAYGFDSNRTLIVPGKESTLEMVCFKNCEPCEPNAIGNPMTGKITVMPNPATGKITISGLAQVDADLSLFNCEGRQVLKITFNQSEAKSIDISCLRSGIYYLTIVSGDNEVRSAKIIKL